MVEKDWVEEMGELLSIVVEVEGKLIDGLLVEGSLVRKETLIVRRLLIRLRIRDGWILGG